MTPDPEKEYLEARLAELEEANSLLRARGRRFADAVALVVALAADDHPDILREAVGRVFDLSGYEAEAARVRAVYEEMTGEVTRLKWLLEDYRQQAERLERQLDRINVKAPARPAQPQPRRV